MTRRASPGMKQALPVPRRHCIGRLRREIVLLQRQEKVGERLRDFPLLLSLQVGKQVRHGGSRHGSMRIAEEGLKVMRMDP